MIITKQNIVIFISTVLAYIGIVLMTGELCIIQGVIGIPCPSCGMTRAYLNLINGNINKAFYYHPLFWIVPIILVTILLKNRVQFFNKLNQSKVFWIIIGLLVIGVYIYRMVNYFPGFEPVDFNENAIFPSIYRIFFTN